MKKWYTILFALILTVLVSSSTEAAAISFNEKISGTATKEDWLKYDITIPELGFLTIDFEGAKPDLYPKFELRQKETNTKIFEGWIGSQGVTEKFGLKAGTYEVLVSTQQGSATAPFSFTTTFEAGHTYDAEPNNQFSEAQKIPANTIIKGTGPGADIDVYEIQTKEKKNLQLSVTGAGFTVYDNKRQIVSHSYLNKAITIPINSGTYYIQTEGDHYELTYSFTELPGNSEIEMNNTLETATALPLNKQMNAEVNHSSDKDIFAFSVPELGFAKIDLQKKSTDRYDFIVYDNNGKELFHFSRADSFQMGLKPGNYYLSIQPEKWVSAFEKYALIFSFEHNVYPSIENNDTVERAQALPFNTLLRAITPGEIGNQDTYKLTIEKDSYQEIQLRLDSSTHTALSISDSKGVSLGSTFSEVRSELTYGIGLRKGIYYLHISTHDPIPYTLKLTKKSDYGELENNHLEQIASPVHLNKLMFGYINSRNDSDYYTFTLDQPKPISWTIDPKMMKSVKMLIFNPSYWMIVDGDFNNAYSGTKVLPKGKYFVKITSPTDDLGEYTLLLKDILIDFKDVPSNHLYYKEITKMRHLGVITGYEDNTFKPMNSMKRHHVAAMVARSKPPAIPMMYTPREFSDVPIDHPNHLSIQKLLAGDIIDWNNNGFNPNGTLTRAQMAKILVKAYQLVPRETSATIAFKDVSKTDWYWEYVQILAQNGITTGDKGYFKPNQPITRQHFSVFLARTMNK